jgi:hypothetical protein
VDISAEMVIEIEEAGFDKDGTPEFIIAELLMIVR